MDTLFMDRLNEAKPCKKCGEFNDEEKYQVTIDFSDCKWLLRWLKSSDMAPALKIKRILIDNLHDNDLRDWVMSEIVS